MFWERFYNLCIDNGTKPNAVAKQLGFSSAVCTQWKQRGTTPKVEYLHKIAAYFGVSVDYLSGNSPEPSAAYKIPECAERLGINENTPRVLPTRSALFEDISSFSESEYKSLEDFVEYIKHKRNHSST